MTMTREEFIKAGPSHIEMGHILYSDIAHLDPIQRWSIVLKLITITLTRDTNFPDWESGLAATFMALSVLNKSQRDEILQKGR